MRRDACNSRLIHTNVQARGSQPARPQYNAKRIARIYRENLKKDDAAHRMRSQPGQFATVDGYAFFFDIDGTLAEIAPSPGAAVIDAETLVAIGLLRDKTGGAVALVSGRQIAEIDRLTGLPDLFLAGVHGAEIRDASGNVSSAASPPDVLREICKSATARFADLDGVLIETKPVSVALHYRLRPAAAADIAAFADEVVRRHPQFKRLSGKMIDEIVPRSVDKGSAILDLLSRPPFLNRTPVFVGDDVTDEDGFAAVNSRDGLSIKIGDGHSLARYGFESAKDFRDWLRAIASAGRPQSAGE